MNLWLFGTIYIASMFATHLMFKRGRDWDRFIDRAITVAAALFATWWWPLYWNWLQGLLGN